MKYSRKIPFASSSFDEGDHGDLPYLPRDGNRPEHVSCDMPATPDQVAALYDEEKKIAGKKKKSNKIKPVPAGSSPPALPSFFTEDDMWIVTKPNPKAGAVVRGRVELITGDDEEDSPASPHQFAEEIDWSSTSFEEVDWSDWDETSKQKSPFFSRHSSSKINEKVKGMSNKASATTSSTIKASTTAASTTTASIRTDFTTAASTATASTTTAAPPAFTMPLSNSSRAGVTNNRSAENTRLSQTRAIGRPPTPPMEAHLDRDASHLPLYHETEATVVQSVEATLIRNEPRLSLSIYDAVAIENENNGSFSWWKRYRKWVFLVSALLFIIGILAGAVVTLILGAGSGGNGDDADLSQVNSQAPVTSPSSSIPNSFQPSADSTQDASTPTPTNMLKDVTPQTPSPTSTLNNCTSGISEQSRNRQSSFNRTPLAGCLGYTDGQVDCTCPAGTLYDVKLEVCEQSDKVQCEAAPEVPISTKIPTDAPTKQPTKAIPASPNVGEISTPIFIAPPTGTDKPTMSPSLSPLTASPVTSSPTSKPSSLPTRSPVTESPTTGQPTTPTPITPFPTSPVSTPATPRPTPSPTTLAPTTRKPTRKPTLSPTTLTPTTRWPTVKPTPLPNTLAPTTKQPIPIPSMSPSLSPLTDSPISSTPTISPTLHPTSTAKPSSLPSRSLLTESPMTGQPTTPTPINLFTTSAVSTPATPGPTPSPTTLEPTTMKPTHKPTPLSTTLTPTTRRSTIKPTPLSTTLAPITKQPIPIPSMSPSLSPLTDSPISSTPTISPTSTAKPRSLPSRSALTESPVIGQPTTLPPINLFPAKPLSTPATPGPTPSTTTIEPTRKPTPLPTTLAPTIKQPTPTITTLPTTLGQTKNSSSANQGTGT